MLLNCGAGEDSWESLGHQDQTSQSYRKSTLNIHWKDWCWSSKTLVTWCEEQTHWKRHWCWERLKSKGEGRGWNGLTASPTQCTWIWANPGRQWKTGKPGMLQSRGLQRVRHDSATKQQQHLCSWIIRFVIVKMAMIPKAIYRFNAIPIKTPVIVFTEMEDTKKFIQNYKGVQKMWKKRGLILPNFKIYYKATEIKAVWY